MNILIKGLKHFTIICRHKYYVFLYCLKAGIPCKGILHDLSKFSPTEFFESIKYYKETESPINACKREKGVSLAWMHHKGRNPHHYEYWQDNFDKGGQPVKMPYKCAIELVCDYLGAGKAYMKDKFSFQAEYIWGQNKRKNHIAMHPHTLNFVENLLKRLAQSNNPKEVLAKEHTLEVYNATV